MKVTKSGGAKGTKAGNNLGVKKSPAVVSKGGKGPTIPTKPLLPPDTPFCVFLDYFIEMWKEKSPNNNKIDIRPYTDAGVIWKTMSDDDKAPFVQKLEDMRKDYEKAMVPHNNKLMTDREEILANMKNKLNVPVITPSTTHLDNEKGLGSKSDNEKQHHVEANENELGSKSDSEKQHHVEANENELGSKSDSEKQHHVKAPFDIHAHHETSCSLARNILQAYSFQSAEEIGNYFLDNRGKIMTTVNQLISRHGGGAL